MKQDEALVVMNLAAVAYLYANAADRSEYEDDLKAAAAEFGRVMEVQAVDVDLEINAEGGEA